MTDYTRTIPPDEYRCRALNVHGSRCHYWRRPVLGATLCGRHLEAGAVEPHAWTSNGLPVFEGGPPPGLPVYEMRELAALAGGGRRG